METQASDVALNEDVKTDANLNDSAEKQESVVENSANQEESTSEQVAASQAADTGDASKSEEGAGDDDKPSRNQRRRENYRKAREESERKIADLEARLAESQARPLEKPEYADFDNDADYQAALTTYNVRKSLREEQSETARVEVDRIRQQSAKEREQEFSRRIEEMRPIYADLDKSIGTAYQVFEQTDGPGKDALREAINSDDGVEIAYYYGNNPDELRAILKMQPLQAAMEIGRVQASGLTKPQTRAATKAPAPIEPLKAGGAGAGADLDRLREEAAKTGDMSKLMAAKRAQSR